MKAMVLAAGQGTRLHPITDSRPKALVPLAGRPMIEYALLLLRHYGIGEIIINLHHFGEQIEDRLGDGQQLGLNIMYSKETELLDTGGGLLKAKAFLQDGSFIVINTDALIDLNLAEVIAFHKSKNAAATLVLRPDENAEQYGSMDIDEHGRICRFLQTRAPIRPAGSIRDVDVFRRATSRAHRFRLYGRRSGGAKVQHDQGNLSENVERRRNTCWILLQRFLAGPWNHRAN